MNNIGNSERLTFVSVVFAAEVLLLELQARSLAKYLDPSCVEEILILDNSVSGMSRQSIRSLASELGPDLSAKLSVLRTGDLGVDTAADGWRSQQAAKLLIARRIRTAHYVILDAKNHLIAPVGSSNFLAPDGTARGGTHSYAEHPLRADLEHTMRYLGASQQEAEAAVLDFPPTATPFVMNTAIVRDLLDDVEARSGRLFSEEFERAGVLEFFLYSAWSALRGPGVPVNGQAIQSAVVWPRAASVTGVKAAIAEAERLQVVWFAVHRRVLARAEPAARDAILRFWAGRGLTTYAEGVRLVRRFRNRYLFLMMGARVAEQVRRLLAR